VDEARGSAGIAISSCVYLEELRSVKVCRKRLDESNRKEEGMRKGRKKEGRKDIHIRGEESNVRLKMKI
jgi:hypothetical protein